ncbi:MULTISPECIES: hypothetical protein [Actinokineospora]|uniref:Uncharacterized protein n=2 Tax=Actinokineospora TaxID=39845 RepID=A0A421B6T5_9PSEU|nr:MULTISPECIES: hypothetical protein [Actinokineospora]RLK60171.1 hypothetical protein CLV68_0669 [Actinokineospora cianjurensis]SES48946.1 hypothetical protein SAMN04487818_12335 [Actinokineospora terrae]
MTGIPGRTAVTESLKALPAQLTPPVELPAGVHELAVAAAAALGWDGTVLPEMTLHGRRVCLVVDLKADVHAERICLGQEPVTDRASVSTWAWPELNGRVPEPAVRIVGAIAVARHWRTGLANAVPFLRYGDTAMVLPTSAVLTHDYLANCLPRSRAYGVAIVSAEPDAKVELDLPGRQDRAYPEVDALYRWVSELAYDQILDGAAATS